MRIISGSAKGRRLFAPHSRKSKDIRPTTDRAKEALFSILGNDIVGAQVLDLFAGVGSLGLESLSRGAKSCLFVDSSYEAISLISKNCMACSFQDKFTTLKRDLDKGLFFLEHSMPGQGFSLVFLDPPYRKGLSQKILDELGLGGVLVPGAKVIVEESVDLELTDASGCLSLCEHRTYGETSFWIYSS